MRQRIRRWLGRGLRVEQLEPRQMLATNMAVIEGTVFDDADGDGVFDPAEDGISGVTVALAGTDVGGAVNRTAVTAADGSYHFENLLAGTYQVTQLPPPPTGFLPNPAGSPANVTVTTTQAAGTAGTSVDDFEGTQQIVSATLPGINPDQSSVADSQAIGGSRDLVAQVTTTLGQVDLSSNQIANPGVLASASANNTRARSTITWDGGNDPNTVDHEGLNSDLTDGGQSIGLQLMVGVDQPQQMLTIRVFTDATDWSFATVPLTETGGLPTSELLVPFSVFTAVAGGADFADVGAIQLEYVATQLGADFAVDWITAIGPTRLDAQLCQSGVDPRHRHGKSDQRARCGHGRLGPAGLCRKYRRLHLHGAQHRQRAAVERRRSRRQRHARHLGRRLFRHLQLGRFQQQQSPGPDGGVDIQLHSHCDPRCPPKHRHRVGEDSLGQSVSDTDPSNHVGIPLPRIVSKRRIPGQ